MTQKIQHTLTIPDELGGLRLDQAIVKLLPQYSRTQIQDWIKTEQLKVNGEAAKAKLSLQGDEIITIDAEAKVQAVHIAEDIALDIVYEDDSLLVINKPAGMVVHPAVGNPKSTLLNALLHHCKALHDLPRAGIIHRLDKNTTGLLVIAKTEHALKVLTAELKARSISRIYQAIINGVIISGGTIDAPILRHPIQRKRMAIVEDGKPSVTHYRVVEKYRGHTRVKVQLETGRTHQIRVHMAHIHHALLGDPVYGGRLSLPKGATPPLVTELRTFKRQALHACELGLTHPVTKKTMTWHAPIPEDMQKLIQILKKDAEEAKS